MNGFVLWVVSTLSAVGAVVVAGGLYGLVLGAVAWVREKRRQTRERREQLAESLRAAKRQHPTAHPQTSYPGEHWRHEHRYSDREFDLLWRSIVAAVEPGERGDAA